MVIYGIIGFPLTHSFSKQYFSNKIEKEGITGAEYHTFPLTSINEFPDLIKNGPLIRGLSVTIPYKEKVLQFINHFSNEVIEIGATNCISIKDGKLTAYNTDIIGFEKSFVKKLLSNHTKALVLGTGGASKAVQFVLKKIGIQFLVVSRNISEHKKFIQYSQVTKEIMDTYSIIINATPLGMSPLELTCPPFLMHQLPPNIIYTILYISPKRLCFCKKASYRELQ